MHQVAIKHCSEVFLKDKDGQQWTMLMSEPVLGSSFVKYNFITAQHSTYLNFGVKQLPAEI